MKRLFTLFLVVTLTASTFASEVFAQDPGEGDKPSEEAKPAATPETEVPSDAEPVEGAESPEEAPAEEAPLEEAQPAPVEEPEETKPEEEESPFGGSPIADLATEEFVPLEDIEEETLAAIIPAEVYPRFEWGGGFRFRSEAAVNYSLGTEGTSAILPPLETYTSAGNPDRNDTAVIDPDKELLWSSNLRLRLDPSIHITEMLEVHMELDFLDNIVMGSLPASRTGEDLIQPDLSTGAVNSGQYSARERNWYEDAVKVNEAYGVVRSVFGELWAGRMDDHYGLGMWLNDGDCQDCNYGDHTDRVMLRSGFYGIYGTASVDFPDEGVTSRSPARIGGQAYDAAQIDDADQFSLSITRSPVTREDREIQQKRLLDDNAVVPNGGIYYRYRNQVGAYDGAVLVNEPLNPEAPPLFIYKGLRVHMVDVWAQLLYEPDFDTKIRIDVEGLMGFGYVDNASGQPVGGDTDANEDAINCTDEDVRGRNPERCLDHQQDVIQYGLALESEFHFGGPVTFGLNGGFASGGDTPNYGTGGANPDFDFFRFNPDYQVDLILFRNVIGTVTNAAYYNPYISAAFLESGSSKVQLDVDAILSHALVKGGTASGTSAWLGLEMDLALRYVMFDTFEAALEGGLLFPFDGLDAKTGRPKYTRVPPAAEFSEDVDAEIAWTAQAKFFWNF